METATIENQTWGVKLTENKLIVPAPKTNVPGQEYEEQIYIKIFSKEGYCRVVKLPVKMLTTEIDANSALAWQRFRPVSYTHLCRPVRQELQRSVQIHRQSRSADGTDVWLCL